jgi:hypothetical protein
MALVFLTGIWMSNSTRSIAGYGLEVMRLLSASDALSVPVIGLSQPTLFGARSR